MKTMMWCIEAPNGNLLKELIYAARGTRLLFTDNWDDDPIRFSAKSDAERFHKINGLAWTMIAEHETT